LHTREEGDVVVVDVGAGLGLPIAARRLAKSGSSASSGPSAYPEASGSGRDERRGSRFGHERVTGLGDGLERRHHAYVSKELLDYGYRTSAFAGTIGDRGAIAPSRR